MRRVLSIVIILLMLLTLCGCSAGTGKKKDDLIAEAVELRQNAFVDDVLNNPVKAENTYNGKTYLITGAVSDITAESVSIGGVFTIALSKDEIMLLDNYQVITVVGIIDSFETAEESNNYGGTTIKSTTVKASIKNGYLVSDTQEITGTLKMYYTDSYSSTGKVTKRTGDASAWWLAVVTGSVGSSPEYHLEDAIPVTHTKGVDITKVTISGKEVLSGQNITIRGKVYYWGIEMGSSVLQYNVKDVELVSINS